MGITHDDVRHVARLSRLAITDDDVNTMTNELGAILEHVGKISELDLDGVEPTTHALNIANVTGEDVVRESLAVETALRNAPDHAEGSFRVPQMRS